MTQQEQFDKVVEKRIEKIKSVLLIKAKEYQRNNNVYHNFDVGARMTNQSREKVLYGFLLKHLISFQDMINDIEADKLPTIETLEEKIGDIVNYCILFEASVKDKVEIKNNSLSFITSFRKEIIEEANNYEFREKLEEITNPLKTAQDLISSTSI